MNNNYFSDRFSVGYFLVIYRFSFFPYKLKSFNKYGTYIEMPVDQKKRKAFLGKITNKSMILLYETNMS